MVSEVLERPKRLKPEKMNWNLDLEESKVAQSTVYTLISTVIANKLGTIRVETVTHVRVKFDGPFTTCTFDVNVGSFWKYFTKSFQFTTRQFRCRWFQIWRFTDNDYVLCRCVLSWSVFWYCQTNVTNRVALLVQGRIVESITVYDILSGTLQMSTELRLYTCATVGHNHHRWKWWSFVHRYGGKGCLQ